MTDSRASNDQVQEVGPPSPPTLLAKGPYQIQVVVGGELKYVYLGTTTTQLYFDPMIGVDVDTPTADNKATIFNVVPTGDKSAGDNLWILSNSVTPNVSASVNIRMLSPPQEYNIYMNTPVNENPQAFYIENNGSNDVSICFDIGGKQMHWHPLADSDATLRKIIAKETTNSGDRAKFRLVPA